MIVLKRTGPWAQVARLLATAPHRVHAAVDKAVLQEAQFLRTKLVEGLREQAPGGQPFAPLAPTTLAIRRLRGFSGSKALLVQGDLRNAITVTRSGDQVHIGVLRTAKSRTGQPLVDIAALNEHGSRPRAFALTPKARAFLHLAFRRAGLDAPHQDQPGTGLAVLQIPARPFFAPVFEKYAQPSDVARRFLQRVAAQLGGDLGTA